MAAPNPPLSQEEDDSDTSEDSDEEEGRVSSLSVRIRKHPTARMLPQQSTNQLPSTKEVYGFELNRPPTWDMALYER